MIKPDESAVTVFCVEVRPLARQNVGMEVDLHAWNCRALPSNAERIRERRFTDRHYSDSIGERFLNFLAALLAGTARIVIPEIEHRLAEMLERYLRSRNGCLPPRSRNSRSKK